MKKQRKGMEIDGILLLDKPRGISSNHALQRVKRLFNAQKAGHTGSLDPIATGMLPICFGEATKFSQFLLNADKRYSVVARLGVKTTTGDTEGDIISETNADDITDETVKEALPAFLGKIEQVPSMYSAIKVDGKPLYKLARQGIEIERKTRQVVIRELSFLGKEGDEISLDVVCSKGTYIRTLVEDLGAKLGCGAHVVQLQRLEVASFSGEKMISYDTLAETAGNEGVSALSKYLLPVSAAVSSWPEVSVNTDLAYFLRQGQPIRVGKAPSEGWVRLSLDTARFVGVGEILSDGRIAPRRMLQKLPVPRFYR